MAVGAVLGVPEFAAAESQVSYNNVTIKHAYTINSTQRNITLNGSDIEWRFDSFTDWAGDDWVDIDLRTCANLIYFGDTTRFTSSGTWKTLATNVKVDTCWVTATETGWVNDHSMDYTVHYNY